MHLNRALVVCVLLSFFDVACMENRSFQKSWLDRMLANVAQSKIVNTLNQGLAHFDRAGLDRGAQKNGVQDACEQLKELGRKAQEEVGVTQKRIVPIKQKAIPPSEAVAAIASFGFIMVNSGHLNQARYSSIRHMLYHEAIHIKYNDRVMIGIVGLFACMGALPAVKAVLNKSKGGSELLDHQVAQLLIGCTVGYVALKCVNATYGKYCEHRADIEGFYVTKCYQCVRENAEDKAKTLHFVQNILDNKTIHSSKQQNLTDEQKEKRASDLAFARNWIKGNSRYLSINEIQQIADDLKQEGRLCELHKES